MPLTGYFSVHFGLERIDPVPFCIKLDFFYFIFLKKSTMLTWVFQLTLILVLFLMIGFFFFEKKLILIQKNSRAKALTIIGQALK
jgi:hypothetical protein